MWFAVFLFVNLTLGQKWNSRAEEAKHRLMAPKIWLHTVGGGLLSNIPVIFTRSGLEVLDEVMNSYDKKKRAICKFFFFFF